jgi:hypothetical protein
MGYLPRRQMLHDWLTDLGANWRAAMQVGQALSALMSDGAGLGPLLIAVPEDVRQPGQYRGAVLL